DPSLAANVLKVANSSFYHPTAATRIASVPQAVVRLGLNEIRNITVAMCCIKHFSSTSNILDYKEFWRHSLMAAYLCQIIGSHGVTHTFSEQEKQTYFLAGLLHDIGILIYDQFFHTEFERIISYALEKEISFLEAEKTIAGKEAHYVLGGVIIELWKLDAAIIAGVRNHHAPLRAPEHSRRIASAAYFAEYMLCNGKVGSFEGAIASLDRSAGEILNVDPENLDSFFSMAEEAVEKSEVICAMEFGTGLRTIK
ncbi:MAG: HDOD domain-containing protein, partial [Chitinivibrionales bacterium]|nr:HDOD domain-containing protein [Chitinivibrionales bacterium]